MISTLGQLRLIIVAATIGAIVGSLALLPRDDLRPLAIAAVAGIILLALTFAAGALPLTRVPSVGGRYTFHFARLVVTFAGLAAIVFAFNVMVGSQARGTSPPQGSQPAPVRPSPSATAQATAPVTPTDPSPRAASVAPAVAPTPERPQSAAPATSSPAPSARNVPTPSPAATAAPPPTPPATSIPASPSPAPTAAPTPTPTSLIPTLPPLPTLPGLP